MTAEQVTAAAWRVLAGNPGPMTLDGTNTWVLRRPGETASVVVDPGPADPGHLDAVLAAAGRPELILLTHRHADHAEGAGPLADRCGAPVRAAADVGAAVRAAGLELRVVATPGHTADSCCLLLAEDAALLTGDTVLGRGTTVVAHPEGRLGDYLASLARLRELPGVAVVLPGHGPVRRDPAALLDAYLRHRRERLDQVRRAVLAGAGSAEAVVETVYADVPAAVRPAALLSARAQLDYLRAEAPGIVDPGGPAIPTDPAAQPQPGRPGSSRASRSRRQ